jgi:hypothetical protein
LQYYIAGQADLGGNVQANVANNVQADVIQLDCSADVSAPTVQTWSQSPADVKSTTIGAVGITSTLTDGCWGVDTATNPSLYYRINPGTNPAYSSGIGMTRTSGTTWTANVPSQTWSSLSGQTLEYYIAGQRDLGNNVQANTPNAVQSDPIQLDCSPDTSPPTVQTWTQAPADVKSTTTGAVTITSVLIDGCWGVNTAVNPTLYYRVNGGSWVSAGAMTRTTGTTWQGSIPDQSWSTHAGQLLEYRIQNQADLGGNVQSGVVDIRSDTIQLDCSPDTSPPTVQTWTQSPSNVNRLTSGVITITVVLTDGCWGVDTATNPTLYYRVNDGTNPAYTNGGAMTFTSGTTWTKTIPDQTWAIQGGKTLEYYIAGQKDLGANVQANVANNLQSDLIDVVTQTTYVATNTPTKGTVANFPNAQSASDANAVATLTEGKLILAASSINVGATDACWSNPNNAMTSDNLYATCSTAARPLQIVIADPSSSSGTITSVIVKAEVSIVGYVNDGFSFAACSSSQCGTLSGTIAGAYGSDVIVSVDLTGKHPQGSGNSWAWSDITDLEIQINGVSVAGGSADTLPYRVDSITVEVSYTGAAQSLDVRMDFSGVPVGASYSLEMRYSRSVDTFRVQVWSGSAWVQRGSQLSASSLTVWTYTLTSAEYQGGAPLIRFVDDTPAGTSTGILSLEYVRVVTS